MEGLVALAVAEMVDVATMVAMVAMAVVRVDVRVVAGVEPAAVT